MHVKEVALKVMTNPQHLRDEITARFNDGHELDQKYVLGAMRVHVPENERDLWKNEFAHLTTWAASDGLFVADEASVPSDSTRAPTYVLVMPWWLRA